MLFGSAGFSHPLAREIDGPNLIALLAFCPPGGNLALPSWLRSVSSAD